MVSSGEIPVKFLHNWDSRGQPTTGAKEANANVTSTSNLTTGLASNASTDASNTPSNVKICSACDSCRQSRVKCSGGRMCQRCIRNGYTCNYSVSLRNGRLKARQTRQSIAQRSQSPISQPKRVGLVNKPSDMVDNESLLPQESSPSDAFQTTNPETENGILEAMGFTMPQGCFTDDIYNFTTMSPTAEDLAFVDPASLLDVEGPDATELNFALSTSIGCNYHSPKRDSSTVPSLSDRGRAFSQCSSRAKNICPSKALTTSAPRFKSGAMPTCRCLTSQFYCSTELCNIQNDSIGLDAILHFTHEAGKHVANYLSCQECPKRSVHFIFPTIILQCLVKLFCKISKNGLEYMKTMKISVGTFELSDEEDLKHKKLLVISAAKNIDLALEELGDTVCQYQREELIQQKSTDLTTDSGKSNLKWIFDNVRNLRMRQRTIIEILESRDWISN